MNSYINKKQTLRQKKMAVKKWLVSATCRTGLMLFIVFFGLLYLLQTNTVSSKGYQLSDLEAKLLELEREDQKLDVEISKYRSMDYIQERLDNMDMVASDHVTYVHRPDTVVARK